MCQHVVSRYGTPGVAFATECVCGGTVWSAHVAIEDVLRAQRGSNRLVQALERLGRGRQQELPVCPIRQVLKVRLVDRWAESHSEERETCRLSRGQRAALIDVAYSAEIPPVREQDGRPTVLR